MLLFFLAQGKAMKTKRFKGERLNEGHWIIHNLLHPQRVGQKVLRTSGLCMNRFGVKRC